MLPWELIIRLDLPLFSLIQLSQTNRAWRNAFSDDDWKELYLAEYEGCAFGTTTKLITWLQAAKWSSSHPFQQPIAPFTSHNYPVYYDTPLPHDFYCLCKRTGNMKEDPAILFGDSGYFNQLGFVNLSEEDVVYDPHVWYEDGILSNSYGIEMEIEPQRPCTVRSSANCLLVLFEAKTSSGLYIKYKSEDTIKLDKLPKKIFGASRVYLFDTEVLIVCENVFLTVKNGVLQEIPPPKEHINSQCSLLKYNKIFYCTDSDLWGEDIGIGTTLEVIQDQEFTQYAVSYNSEGLLQRLVDLESHKYMQISDIAQSTPITLVGVSYEELGVYTFSSQYLARCILR